MDVLDRVPGQALEEKYYRALRILKDLRREMATPSAADAGAGCDRGDSSVNNGGDGGKSNNNNTSNSAYDKREWDLGVTLEEMKLDPSETPKTILEVRSESESKKKTQDSTHTRLVYSLIRSLSLSLYDFA